MMEEMASSYEAAKLWIQRAHRYRLVAQVGQNSTLSYLTPQKTEGAYGRTYVLVVWDRKSDCWMSSRVAVDPLP